MAVFRFDVSKAPAYVLNWIRSHPGQTALIIVNVGVTSFILFSPAALTVPLLASMGFGAQGPMVGSVAAWLQACIGNVGAGSAFAYLQSAGMAGYGAPIINGICQAFAVAGSAGQAATWWCWGGKPKSEAPPQPQDGKIEAPPQPQDDKSEAPPQPQDGKIEAPPQPQDDKSEAPPQPQDDKSER